MEKSVSIGVSQRSLLEVPLRHCGAAGIGTLFLLSEPDCQFV